MQRTVTSNQLAATPLRQREVVIKVESFLPGNTSTQGRAPVDLTDYDSLFISKETLPCTLQGSSGPHRWSTPVWAAATSAEENAQDGKWGEEESLVRKLCLSK